MKMTDEKNKTDKQYTLAYGFRRFSACKKLGWTKIPVYLQKENKVLEVGLDEIFLPENTRMDETSETFISLMQSIKQHGLLEPVGVWNTADLSEKDYLILNLIENLQREGISPFGLSQAVKRLNQLGLTNGEVAVRLSMPKSRINDVMRLTDKLPSKLIKQASYIGENKRDTTGRLPIAVVQSISQLRMPDEKKNTELLIEAARQEELGVNDIGVIAVLIGSGMSPESAIKKRREYTSVSARIIVKNEEWEKVYGNKRGHTNVIRAMLAGKIPLNSKMFYFDKKSLKKDSD